MQQKQIPPPEVKKKLVSHGGNMKDSKSGRNSRPLTEEAGIVAPVPFTRVQHIRCKNTGDYAHDDVETPPEHHSLDLKSACGDFGNERVTDCADGELVHESPAKHDTAGSDRTRPSVFFGYETEEAKDHEHGAQAAEAIKV